MKVEKAIKNFVGNARRALAIEGLTLVMLARELECHVTSVSRSILSGGRVCPTVHRRVSDRLKIKPLI